VFDLHTKFASPAPSPGDSTRLVLIDSLEGPVALLVDAVEEVVLVARDDLQAVQTPGEPGALAYLRGVLRREHDLVLWVDHRLLAPAGIARALQAAAA